MASPSLYMTQSRDLFIFKFFVNSCYNFEVVDDRDIGSLYLSLKLKLNLNG